MTPAAAPGPTYCLLLNERSLPALVGLLLRRARVCLMERPALLPGLDPWLKRMAALLVRRKWCLAIDQLDPDLAIYREIRVPRFADDSFARAESWVDDHYDFEALARALGQDDLPFRQITCNHILGLFEPVFFLRRLDGRPDASGINVVGADAALLGLYQALHGNPKSLRFVFTLDGRRVLNILFFILAFFTTLLRGLASLRPSPPSARRVFLGCDFSGHPVDEILWGEISPDKTDVMVVFRSRQQRQEQARRAAGFSSCALGDGWLPLGGGLAEIARTLSDLARHFRLLRHLEPEHFLRVMTLAPKRLAMRKLLNAYAFANFWTRDDYNVEHLLRTQELRRIGSRVLGVSHGLPIEAAVVPMWRYVDLDTYYVLGRRILDYYRKGWSSAMRLVPTGSLGLTRNRQARLAAPRPDDIIFQSKAECEMVVPPLLETLSAIARAFPDRRIYLQIKGSFRGTSLADRIVGEATAAFANVIESRESIYELFLRARHLVTDPSTIALEAIQFGLTSIVMDYDGRRSLYFRDGPGLCVTSPAETLEKLQGYVSGTRPFVPESHADLVDLSGKMLYDRVREDLGLPAFSV